MSVLQTIEKPAAPAGRRIEYVTPRVNLHQDADGYTLEVEMPGVGRDGVEITLEDGRLSIVGRRPAPADPGHAVYRERNSSDFRRVFDLDPGIDAGKISARMDQGLLVVRLLKAEAVKPRKIAVA
ncbi:MAG TPA: Hsp20/alpha crystallin family protein [Terrimicrobiaceae bacterium]|nr:Hsp20/alpha crystallin family protein [Terrimicrobiaceae bacterium]